MTNLTALPIGTELVDDYRIDRVLGAGGFGITYLATELALERKVTIKEYFPTDYAARKDGIESCPRSKDCSSEYKWGLERFIEEAQTLAKFDHPNIVRVYRYFRANNTAYMVLHFEEGQSFKSWLKNLGRAPRQNELDKILEPLLDALELIHAQDFLHRDIAPDNIIIRKDDSPVLIDFGSARREIASQSKTVSALVKPGYSPYEQYAEKSSNQGPWTDIYALGATLYHAITGKRAPDAPSRMVADEIRPAREAALSAYRPKFLNAIDKALSLRIETRPQTIAAWRTDLFKPATKRTWLSGGREKQKNQNNLDAKPTPAEKECSPIAAEPQVAPDANTVRLNPESQPEKSRLGFFKFISGPKRQQKPQGKHQRLSAALEDVQKDNKLEPTGDVLERTREPTIEKNAPADNGPRKPMGRRKAKPNEQVKSPPDNNNPEPSLADEPVPPPPAFLVPAKPGRRRRARPRPMRSMSRSFGTLVMNIAIGASIAGIAIAYQDRIKEFLLSDLWKSFSNSDVQSAKAPPSTPKVSQTTTGALQKRTAPNPLLQQISTQQGEIAAAAFTKSGRSLVTLGKDNSLKVWNPETSELLSTITLGQGKPTALAIQGSSAAVGHDDGYISIWNLKTRTLQKMLRRNEASIWSLAYTGVSGRIAAASHDWKVALWDVNSPAAPIHVFDTHTNAVQVVAFSPKLDYLASGGADRRVNMYNLRTLDFVRTYRRHNDFVTSLAFSPDGKYLATGTLRGEIRIWSTQSRRLLRRLRGHRGEVADLAFSKNAARLASAGADGKVRIWTTQRGRTLRTYASHQGKVTDVAFDPNGARLASVGDDGNIRMWNVGNFQ